MGEIFVRRLASGGFFVYGGGDRLILAKRFQSFGNELITSVMNIIIGAVVLILVWRLIKKILK